MISTLKLQRGKIPQKCRWSDHCQSLHVVWSCFIFLRNFVKYLKRYQSYRADMISILKITMGNNSSKNVDGLTVFNRLAMLYICAKFREIISNGIKFMKRTGMMNR